MISAQWLTAIKKTEISAQPEFLSCRTCSFSGLKIIRICLWMLSRAEFWPEFLNASVTVSVNHCSISTDRNWQIETQSGIWPGSCTVTMFQKPSVWVCGKSAEQVSFIETTGFFWKKLSVWVLASSVYTQKHTVGSKLEKRVSGFYLPGCTVQGHSRRQKL